MKPFVLVFIAGAVQKVDEKKIQATLAHIHALTQQEAGEYAKVNLEELPNRLEKTQPCWRRKWEGWTEQITQARDSMELLLF